MNQRRETIVTHPALLPLAGNYDRKPRSLDRDVTTVGRARGSDLCLEANEISTLHCVIYRASDGYRIRDCSSRTGTRVNGESVKNHGLHDGDIINLGPFSFELRIPPELFPKESQKPDQARVVHWKNSRRKLALRALKLRDRLLHGNAAREQELMQKANLLKEKIRSYDHRSSELEAAERELTQDDEKLRREAEAHLDHVQKVEKTLAHRLADAEQEIHRRWQEFQQRCLAEETRLQKLASIPHAPGQSSSAHDELVLQQQQELAEKNQRLRSEAEQLAQQQHLLQSERQEFLTMKEQWVKEQSLSAATTDEQKVTLAQQEAALKAQKAELLRMMGDVKKLQESLRKQCGADAQALRQDNERLQRENAELLAKLKREDNVAEVESILEENQKLRDLVKDRDAHSGHAELLHAEIDRLRDQVLAKDIQLEQAHAGKPAEHHGPLQAENNLLKKLLQEKDQFIQELSQKAHERPKTENDLERYESELNADRRQLEMDRAKLTKELETLRELKREIEEQESEMEMNMSKERADLARERMRLERVREEIKTDTERLQREISVRDSMAPVQKLREEINSKQAQSGPGKADKALNDRLRAFRTQLSDSPPQNTGS